MAPSELDLIERRIEQRGVLTAILSATGAHTT
jgi:hypothetical protein